MKVDVKIPTVGESITEATIDEWQKSSGDFVNQNDILLVLETDKASVEVVAEKAGKLNIKVEAGETVEIGAVVGSIDTSASDDGGDSDAKSDETKKSETSNQDSKSSSKASDDKSADNKDSSENKQNKSNSKDEPSQQDKSSAQSHSSSSMASNLSPAVRKIVEDNNLDSSQIKGSGPGGRITKEDALKASKEQKSQTQKSGQKSSDHKKENSEKSSQSQEIKMPARSFESRESHREKMTNMRKRIAERLVQVQQQSAILTTFNEVDMTKVMALRSKYKDSFEKKYGIRLGFMGFFVKAAIAALKDFPAVNAYIDGEEIVYNDFVNMGIAVGGPKGLVVPVVKNADQMSIAEIEATIKNFGQKAKNNKISIDDLSGGTFTISNGGVYGSLMSTPILNPPQSAILGMHKIEERPVAINGEVQIRPMMYLAVSYDHRIIDGKESVSFLVKLKEAIEDPSRLILEV